MLSFKKLFSSSLMILVVNSNVYAEKASSFAPILMDNLIMFVPINNLNPIEKFDGIWEGRGTQSYYAIASEWSIKIDIDSNNETYLIEYPSLNCGGVLSLISCTSNRIDFSEKITYGKSRCIDNGITSLVKTGQDASDYFWEDTSSSKIAWGKVKRL